MNMLYKLTNTHAQNRLPPNRTGHFIMKSTNRPRQQNAFQNRFAYRWVYKCSLLIIQFPVDGLNVIIINQPIRNRDH